MIQRTWDAEPNLTFERDWLRQPLNLTLGRSVDERLAKQWQLSEALLREAMAELPESDEHVLDYLSHNEFGLALGDLIEIGREGSPSSSFWRLLKQAADLMGANRYRADVQHRYREAITRESKGS